MSLDLDTRLDQFQLLPDTEATATANGTGVNVSTYIGKLKATLGSEAGGGTTPTLDVKIQDSADDVSYADVAGLTFTQVTDAALAFESISIDTRKVRKFIRAVETITGTSPTFVRHLDVTGQKKTK